MSHEGLHEQPELLDDETVDHHRAIESIVEELEAIDWYDQRARATGNAELASVLVHNRDDEKEHAAMALEWVRRRDPQLDAQLRLYLFTDGPLASVEDAPPEPLVAAAGTGGRGLGIGSLREAS
jgi:ferritin-like protein